MSDTFNKRAELAQRTLDRLMRFTRSLKNKVPIEAKRVRVEQTPDGPLTTKTHCVINQGEQ